MIGAEHATARATCPGGVFIFFGAFTMNMQCIVQVATPRTVIVAVGSRSMIDEGWYATVATCKSVETDQSVNGGWSFPQVVIPNMGTAVGVDVALAIADALRAAAAFDVASLAQSLERAGLLAKP